MIDYRSNIAGLESFRQSLRNASFADPKLAAARDEQISDVDKEPGMAALGALVNHLIWHAASDGSELDLAERAAELWKAGLTLYALLGEHRLNLEAALADPTAPDAVEHFNAAMQASATLQSGVEGKEVEVALLREDIFSAAFPAAHPRQQDKRLDQWTWADIFLARRTDAFCRASWNQAVDPKQKAFAFGVMSSYGANVYGSAYLGQVVGGPRRTHRYRDRLARNTLGSRLAQTYPQVQALSDIAASIRYGLIAPHLPTTVENLITAAIGSVYDTQRVPALPDLKVGYSRLLRHIEALDTFSMPSKPALPRQPFLQKIYGDTANPSFSIVEATVQTDSASGSGSGSGGVKPKNLPASSAPGQQDSKRNSKLDCGAFFLGLFQFLAGTALFWAPCWESWGKGESCKLWDGMSHDLGEFWASLGGGQGAPSNVGTTGQQLSAASNSQQMIDLIHSLYDTHTYFWEALNSAYVFMARAGLIYPDRLLTTPLYQQLASVPASTPSGWPHVPVAGDSADEAHLYPTSAIELPPVMSLAYPPGAPPTAFLTGSAIGGGNSVDLATAIWRQTVTQVLDANNRDLDADRGPLHACWTARGSINDSPVDVAILNYSDT